MKFLIDECLSLALADKAVAAGHVESAHVSRRGMNNWQDHRLMKPVIDDDWTLVTRNSDDFRPRRGSASQAPCYVGQPLHAGLVCLNLPAKSYGTYKCSRPFQRRIQTGNGPSTLICSMTIWLCTRATAAWGSKTSWINRLNVGKSAQ